MLEVDNEEDLRTELEKNDKVLVLFYASWCPYCTRFVPYFKKKVNSFNFGAVIHVLLDDYDNPLWDDYDIEAVPTLILFEKNKIIDRLNGRFGVGLKEDQLKVWLEKLDPK